MRSVCSGFSPTSQGMVVRNSALDYTDRLGTQFRYVVHIPIKERSHHMPKYRLVFATDYHDGLFLMAKEMNAAWHKLLDQERGGQLYLFDATELEALRGPTIQEKITAEVGTPIPWITTRCASQSLPSHRSDYCCSSRL